jgi:hypothetical protein
MRTERLGFESASIKNSPNLSILPLLAYHKVCNDHYRNEKWQPFEPWTCNIDYLSPTANMNAATFIQASTFTRSLTSLIDLENSNLPIDYFTSVLPRAQYGDESAASIGIDNPAYLKLNDAFDKTVGAAFDSKSAHIDDNLQKQGITPTSYEGTWVSPIRSIPTRA